MGLSNLSDTLRPLGALYESESAVLHALRISREVYNRDYEAIALYLLGSVLLARGENEDSAAALHRSLRIAKAGLAYEAYDNQAVRSLWIEDYGIARDWADKALSFCQAQKFERGEITASRLQGEAALGLNDFTAADERLHHALTRARKVNFVEEELPALVALAELQRRQGDKRPRANSWMMYGRWRNAGHTRSFTLMPAMCWRRLSAMRAITRRQLKLRQGLSPSVVRWAAVRLSLGSRKRQRSISKNLTLLNLNCRRSMNRNSSLCP